MPHTRIYMREHSCAMICSLGCWLECVTLPKMELITFYNTLINIQN